MKSFILILLALLGFTYLNAQKIYFGKQINGFKSASSQESYTAINSKGYHFIAGVYEDSVDVDNDKLYSTTTNNWYDEHSFLIKYRPNGIVDTIITSNGPGHFYIEGIEMGEDDNFYIRGIVYGVASIGTASLVSGNSWGSNFLIKFDEGCNVLWSKLFPHSSATNFSGVTKLRSISPSRLAVYGFVRGIDTIDGHIINEANGSALIAYVDGMTGNYLWIKQIVFNTLSGIHGLSISNDDSNNVYITSGFGSFSNPSVGSKFVVFNSSDTLFVRGGLNHMYESFIAKYDSNGNYLWSKRLDTLYPHTPSGLAIINNRLKLSTNGIYTIDKNGTILQRDTMNGGYISQFVKGSHSLFAYINIQDSMQYKNQTYIDTSSRNFLARFDSSSNLQWLFSMPDTVAYPFIDVNKRDVISYTSTTNRRISYSLKDILFNDAIYYSMCMAIKDTITDSNMNIIKGRVYNDSNLNCILDTSDQGIGGISIVALPGPFFSKTDSNGFYSIKVDTGIYNVSTIPYVGFKFKYQASCSINSINSINFSSLNNIVDSNLDFPSKIEKCYLLNASLVTPFSSIGSPCLNDTSETFYVLENLGADTVFNIEAKIKFPGIVIYPLQSNPLWTAYSPNDSLITWNFPYIAPNQTILVRIKDTVLCNEVAQSSKVFPFQLNSTPINQCRPNDSIYNQDSASLFYYIPHFTKNIEKSKEVLSIFPNPASKILNVKSEENLFTSTLQIFDLGGSVVLKKEVDLYTTHTMQLDISTLKPGLYFVYFKNDKKNILQITKIFVR